MPTYMAKLRFNTFNCAECGKETCKHSEEWGWKYNGKMFCSWTCQRKYEKEEEEKKQRKRLQTIKKDRTKSRQLTASEQKEAVRMLKDGALIREVAEKYGCSMYVVTKLAQDHGATQKHKPKKPLSAEKIAQIRELKKGGMSNAKIADLVRVGRTTVQKYVLK